VRRILIRVLAGVLLLLLLAVAGAFFLFRSDWFAAEVRERIVREIEQSTGGRAAVATFRFDWRLLRAEVDGIVVHGLEWEAEPPLFQARRVTVGLKVVSALRRKVDIASLEIEQPHVAVTVDSSGRTNLPVPRRARGSKEVIERILDLAVGTYAVRQGSFRYASQVFPLELTGQDLEMSWILHRDKRTYEGNVAASKLRLERPFAFPLSVNADLRMSVTPGRIRFSQAKLATPHSRLAFQGEMEPDSGWKGQADFELNVSLAEVSSALRLAALPKGDARARGSFRTEGAAHWEATGILNGNGITYQGAGLRVEGISAHGLFEATPRGVDLKELVMNLLDGKFTGRAHLEPGPRYVAEGAIEKLALHRLVQARQLKPVPWSGTVSGPVRVEGPDLAVSAEVGIEATGGGIPLSGAVSVSYRESSDNVRFEASHLEFPSSRLHFSGDLSERITFGLVTRDLKDLLPMVAMVMPEAPESIPIQFVQSQATMEGQWSGSLDRMRIEGRFAAGPITAYGREVQQVSSRFALSESLITLDQLRYQEKDISVSGSGGLQLDNWRPIETSALNGRFQMQDTRVETLLAVAKLDWPLQGLLAAQAQVDGSYGNPRAAGNVSVRSLGAWQEAFGQLQADFRYARNRIDVFNGRLEQGPGDIDFQAAIEDRDLRAEWKLGQSRLSRWATVRERAPDLDGAFTASGKFTARNLGGQIQLSSLEGLLRVDQLSIAKRLIGSVTAQSYTENRLLRVNLDARVRDATVQANAEWSLGGNSFGLGQVRISRLTFATLQEIGLLGDPGRQLPMLGVIDAEVGFSGPVLRPELWTGLAKITSIEIEPNRKFPVRSGADARRFVLRNREAILAHLDGKGVHLQSALLVGEGTDLEAEGTFSFQTRSPWNLRLRGRLNLPALSMIEPDLVARGVSTIDATVRGALERPQLSGKMEVRDGVFNLRGLPNGLEKTNGVILFDRTRANIEQLTAQTGGGDLSLTGFIDFGAQDLLYRLQAQARQVRVRYPETVSTTFDANLSLTGTAASSVLGGDVEVSKMGIQPRTDLGSLLVETGAAAAPRTSPNDFIRNMQLDLRIRTSDDAELQTSLARDIQPEAQLHLRGSYTNPVLLGRISVNQGEINFFGSQYTINRGDISFFNPVKVEPVLDLDLETKVRGVTVNINFTGPLGRLDVSYRSDPPLQSTEIVALLTVGRTPGSGITPNLPTGAQSQSFLQAGSNSLLGQAISAPLTGRLQRLFGVSRIKLDPELTGVTNTPQARLSIEQQLSREITMTYITNLNRTQQQIVRLQWDFSRDFSVLAIRDENGVFGIDFLWRKRFK